MRSGEELFESDHRTRATDAQGNTCNSDLSNGRPRWGVDVYGLATRLRSNLIHGLGTNKQPRHGGEQRQKSYGTRKIHLGSSALTAAEPEMLTAAEPEKSGRPRPPRGI
jgi:hypothetical protein